MSSLSAHVKLGGFEPLPQSHGADVPSVPPLPAIPPSVEARESSSCGSKLFVRPLIDGVADEASSGPSGVREWEKDLDLPHHYELWPDTQLCAKALYNYTNECLESHEIGEPYPKPIVGTHLVKYPGAPQDDRRLVLLEFKEQDPEIAYRVQADSLRDADLAHRLLHDASAVMLQYAGAVIGIPANDHPTVATNEKGSVAYFQTSEELHECWQLYKDDKPSFDAQEGPMHGLVNSIPKPNPEVLSLDLAKRIQDVKAGPSERVAAVDELVRRANDGANWPALELRRIAMEGWDRRLPEEVRLPAVKWLAEDMHAVQALDQVRLIAMLQDHAEIRQIAEAALRRNSTFLEDATISLNSSIPVDRLPEDGIQFGESILAKVRPNMTFDEMMEELTKLHPERLERALEDPVQGQPECLALQIPDDGHLVEIEFSSANRDEVPTALIKKVEHMVDYWRDLSKPAPLNRDMLRPIESQVEAILSGDLEHGGGRGLSPDAFNARKESLARALEHLVSDIRNLNP